MRKGTVASTEMTTGWGLRTFTRDALDKLHAATLMCYAPPALVWTVMKPWVS